MRAEDIERLVTLSKPTIHHSGAFAIVAASRPAIAANRTVGQLWRVSLDDGSRVRLTRGVHDREPRLSPDGSTVFFLRDDEREKAQVFSLPLHGGEAVQVTDAQAGVQAFDIDPTGTRVVFSSDVLEPGRYGSVEGVEAAEESPRFITVNRSIANGVGSLIGRRSHIFVTDVPDPGAEPVYERAAHPNDRDAEVPATSQIPPATQLSHGDFDHSRPTFTADGKRVLAVTARHDTRDSDLRNALVEFDADTALGEPHTVVSSRANLSIIDAQVTADDGYVLLAIDTGESGRDFVAKATSLYFVSSPGAHPEAVTDAEAIDLGEVGSHLTVVDDGVLVQDRRRGRVRLLKIADGQTRELVGGDVEVTSHDATGGRIVVCIATPTSAGELAVLDDRGFTVLTDFGAPLAETGIALPTEHEVTARDGASVHGWVWVPEGEGPHPVLLNIHGGPHAQFGVHVFDEAQVAVDAGYAVVQCNPRGSAGYGHAHGRAIKERMGTVDMTDVLDFLDGALDAHPTIDRSRVGIMGGSYGGYLTAWTIAHDERFTAAIVERGYLDPESFVGTSDIGWFFSDEYVGTDPELVRAQSPMAVVGAVTTPTLVVHSEEDWRCPPDGALRYWTALKRQGVETALLLFPGENHELTRSGQPRHRIERFEHVMAWWAKHLPTAKNHA